jgi:hypothetical protein
MSQGRMQAGWNTSTVALRAVRGYEKATQCPGRYNWATLFMGDLNTGAWRSRLGVSEIETINMVLSPAGLRPERDCAGESQQQ